MRVRRRAHLVDAACFDGSDEAAAALQHLGGDAVGWRDGRLEVDTADMSVVLNPGDWLVSGLDGHLDVFTAAEFAVAFEPLDEAA